MIGDKAGWTKEQIDDWIKQVKQEKDIKISLKVNSRPPCSFLTTYL